MVIEPGNNSVNSHASASSKARATVANKPNPEGSKDAKAKDSDNVSLSSASLAIAELEAKLEGASDVDTAKVAEVKAALQAGKYEVDPQAIADKIRLEESQLG